MKVLENNMTNILGAVAAITHVLGATPDTYQGESCYWHVDEIFYPGITEHLNPDSGVALDTENRILSVDDFLDLTDMQHWALRGLVDSFGLTYEMN